MEIKRIFIAINLPKEIKQAIEKAKQGIVDSFPDEIKDKIGKWVPENNLHITLLFIGNARQEQLPKIYSKIKQKISKEAKFNLKLERICYGAIQNGTPKLIWAEIENNESLGRIAKNLNNNNFKAHITLARIRRFEWQRINPEERPDIERAMDIEFEVKSIDIMESKLKRTGPEYSILQTINLC